MDEYGELIWMSTKKGVSTLTSVGNERHARMSVRDQYRRVLKRQYQHGRVFEKKGQYGRVLGINMDEY